MKALIVRRRRLGHSSTVALSKLLEAEGISSVIWRNDRSFPAEWVQRGDEDLTVIRWGCTATVPTTLSTSNPYINQASGIHKVNDKLSFLRVLEAAGLPRGLLPVVYLGTTSGEPQLQEDQHWVVRPPTHSQGRNLRVLDTSTLTTMMHSGTFQGYARPLVQKKSEYRVYVLNGRVVNVAQKTPDNPADIAWNVARGGRFDNVRWGGWPINVVDLACSVAPHTGLHLTGIDIMVDHDDKAWFIEANSAPSLPFNSDGSCTYRQQCIAKGLAYTMRDNPEPFTYQEGDTWRDYVHPAIYTPRGDTQ